MGDNDDAAEGMEEAEEEQVDPLSIAGLRKELSQLVELRQQFQAEMDRARNSYFQADGAAQAIGQLIDLAIKYNDEEEVEPVES